MIIWFKNKLYKETFWSFISKGMTFVLYFLLQIYLARTLGVEKFGAWSLFFSIFTIIAVLADTGINISAKKSVAQYNETGHLRNVLRDSVRLRFFVSFLCCLVYLALSKPLSIMIGRPEFGILFLVSAPLLVAFNIVEFLKAVFTGLHRLRYNFIVNSFEHGLKLIIAVCLLSSAPAVINVVNSFTIALAVTSVVGCYLLYTSFYVVSPNVDKKSFSKEIFKYSIPLIVINISFIVATEIDILMLGLFTNDSEVAFYSCAKQSVGKFPQISLAIAMGVMPIFAKLNEENKEKLRKLYNKLLSINAFIFFVIVSLIMLLADLLIPLIYGAEFSAAVIPLKILSIYVVCGSFSILSGTILDYAGLAAKRAKYLTVSLVVNIILNFVLIPKHGATGAAIATTISYLPYTVLLWLDGKKVFE